MPQDNDSPAPRGGRPARFSAQERESLILDALESVIASSGLQGATVAAIAREAGMSKRTLYTLFPSRDAMFGAWVRRLRESVVHPLTPEERRLPLRDRLRRLLRSEAREGAEARRLLVLRSVIAEAPRHPDLAAAFRLQGPEAARCILEDELARACEAGELRAPDPAAAARLLFDMVHAGALDRLIDPEAPEEPAGEADRRLDLALDVFLDGSRTRERETPGVGRP